MAFEVFGTDIADRGRWQEFAEGYTVLVDATENPSHISGDLDFEIRDHLAEFVKAAPEMAIPFLEFCASDDRPNLRYLAGYLAILDLTSMQHIPPDTTTTILERVLGQSDPANDNIHDFVAELIAGNVTVNSPIGLVRLARIIRAHRQGVALRDASERS